MPDEKQFALVRILEVLAKTSAKPLVYTIAVLGLLALSPNTQIPPELINIAGGFGVNAIGNILDKVAFGDKKLSDEEITKLINDVISEYNLEKLVTKDEFWQGFSRLRKNQEKISEQNEIIISLIQQLESPNAKSVKILFADFSVLNKDYLTDELKGIPSIYPIFSLQQVYDRTNSVKEIFPIVFDLKLVNKGNTTAFLKEVRFEILDAFIDPSPVISYFPAKTQSGNNLLLALKNYGWGSVEVKEFLPFSHEISLFKEIYSDFHWNGKFLHNVYFIFPHTLIGQKIKKFLSREDGVAIEDRSNSINLMSPSTPIPLSGPIINDRERELRDRYLSEGKGISYQDFNGEIIYKEFGNEIEKVLHWGRYRPGIYCDLVFSEDGFHLMEMHGMAGYVPPSHNYNMTLSYADKGKIKKIKISQEIKPDSVERFTITTTSSESCIYRLKVDVLYDTSEMVSSSEIFVHFLAFRKNNDELYDTYVFENGWKQIRS